ncbi:MAG: hypothetical protein WDW38_000140 [Sanguina aurantia]
MPWRQGNVGAPGLEANSSCGVPAVRIVVAGLSQQCSQKAHKWDDHGCPDWSLLLTPHSSYILCLDDDVMLQPTALSRSSSPCGGSISLLEGDDSLFMSTGHRLDECHFAGVAGSVQLPDCAGHSKHSSHSEMCPCHTTAWREGGYSDDLTLASICARDGLAVATPSFAIFPQRLSSSYTWAQYYNYLHRQLYVLDTYASPSARTAHHAMLGVHCWASASLAAAALSGV